MLRVRPSATCANCGMLSLVTEGFTGKEIPDSRKWYQCLSGATDVCLNKGESVYEDIPMDEIIAGYIGEETNCSDLDYIRRNVNDKLPHVAQDKRMLDIIGVYDKETGYIKILNRDTDEEYATIKQYAGELNHWKSGTDIVLSLVYDSGYVVDQLMGKLPIQYEE